MSNRDILLLPPTGGGSVTSSRDNSSVSNAHSNATSKQHIKSPAMIYCKENMTDSQKGHTLLKEGKNFMDLGNVQSAIDCLSEGVSYCPTIVSLYTCRAVCYKLTHKWPEAYFDYSYAIRLEPENSLHYCMRGLVLSKSKRVSMALEDLDFAIKLDQCALNYYSRATIYSDAMMYENALNSYSLALLDENIQHDFKCRCLNRKASALIDMELYHDAIAVLEQLLEMNPNDVTSRFLYGRTLKNVSRLDEALGELDAVIKSDDTNAAYYVERGDAKFRTKEEYLLVDAINDFDMAIKLLKSTNNGGSGNNFSLPTGNRNKSTSSKQQSTADARRSSAIISTPVTTPVLATTTEFDVSEQDLQLADAHYKRAQVKLIAVENTDSYISALNDSITASQIVHWDDDYQLLTASAYIRLGDYASSQASIDKVLQRSPTNTKALYKSAYCKMKSDMPKAAIEDLTKIVYLCDRKKKQHSCDNDKGDPVHLAIPLHRVYEMRGILFHESQAYQLALKDLGNAIVLNPDSADLLFLRGDCHFKLGNYEIALNDFDLAEEKEFKDVCSLLTCRGITHRLLGDAASALHDFGKAYALIEAEAKKSSQVRILNLNALTYIDNLQYVDAHRMLLSALQLIEEELDVETKLLDDKRLKKRLEVLSSLKKSKIKYVESAKEVDAIPKSMQVLYKTRWTVWYHISLSLFMSKDYKHAVEWLQKCTLPDNKDAVVDEFAKGTVLYFLALTLNHLQQQREALQRLEECLSSPWGQITQNQTITYFTAGKVLQSLNSYDEAIVFYSKSISIDPSSSNVFSYFRRAWAYKAIGAYRPAGDDFEVSKRLRPNDPNFSIDYKAVASCEFMCIDNEPDIVQVFPTLWPVMRQL